MPRSRRSSADIKRLAVGLLERSDGREPGLAARLKADLEYEVSNRTDVKVEFGNEALQSGCSIAALLLKDSYPPRIVLAPSLSAHRQVFSIGHEFCHVLINRDGILLDLLFDEPDQGRALEEDVCDAFAAMLLIDDGFVDRTIGDSGITAGSLLRLFEGTRASRAACAVALAQRMDVPGYVIIGSIEYDSDGDLAVPIRFAARAHDTYPIRPGTLQPGTLLEAAAKIGRARGEDQLWFASGARTDTYHVDIVKGDNYLFSVLVSDRPAWEKLSVHRGRQGGFDSSYCPHCAKDFRPKGAICRACGEHACPDCRRCTCDAAPAPRSRVCNGCFVERPGHYFVGDLCKECAE